MILKGARQLLAVEARRTTGRSTESVTDAGELLSEPSISPPGRSGLRGNALVRLLPYLRPYRTRMIVMFIVALASIGSTIAIPLMTRAVIDGPVAHNDERGLWILGGSALLLGVAEAALWMIRRWLVQTASTGVENDIRQQLHARLQVLPMSFHGSWQSGQLLSRVMNDLGMMRRFIGFGSVLLILNVIQVVVVTAILLGMYWPLGLVVLISIGPVVGANLHYERQFSKASRAAQDQTGNVATQVEEAALGLRVVKSFDASSTCSTDSTPRRPNFVRSSCARSRSCRGSGRCSKSSRPPRW